MSFESLVWDITDGAVMGGGAVAQPPILKSVNRSPSFSLPFRRMDDHGEMGMPLANFDPTVVGRMREDDFESRSGSDNLEGASGDDQDAGDDNPRQKKKKKYHRHTPNQIQELEGFFKECPHPDEKQRMELSRRLGLESKQIKFWFQNRRTQMKTQLERHENSILRQENDKLLAENDFLKQTISSPICNTCGGPAVAGEVSYEQHQLRIENARLKDELGRICSLTNKFLGRPLCSSGSSSSLQGTNSNLELAVGRNGFPGSGVSTLPMGLNFGDGAVMPLLKPEILHRSAVDIAIGAMDELVKMSQMESPLWIKNLDGGKETLNHEEYMRIFSSSIGMKPVGFVTEASRDTGVIMMSSLALVEMIMNADQWAEMFPCMIARAETVEVLSSGVGGTRHNTLQLMQAEFQVLSPFVPVRQSRFIRFCKQHAEGLWAVVDISIDGAQDFGSSQLYPSCRRLPSGCVVQDMGNGFSKVTWVEHTDYDESIIGHLFKPFVTSGFGFGAQKWLAALHRQCEFLTLLMSSTMCGEDNTGLTSNGKKSILKLAQRMTSNFCAGICASSTRKWDKLSLGNTSDDVMVLTRKNLNDPGLPPGIVLSASTSVLMPVSRHGLFEFLQNEKMRAQWDILSDGVPILEMVRIAKGRAQENRVSLLRGNAINANVIVQETWNDAAGSVVIYAPVNAAEMEVVMGGGDPVYVAILPSGFAIFPCVSANQGMVESTDGHLVKPDMEGSNGGCVLTVGFQILANSIPTANLTMESVETVKNLISCTIHKIKTALNIAGAAR